MTKKGQKGTYHKPKPRVAVYVGAAGSAGVALGIVKTKDNLASIPANVKAGDTLAAVGNNLGGIVSNVGTAARVALPAVAGVVTSLAADKLGVNKVLAKARMPFRV